MSAGKKLRGGNWGFLEVDAKSGDLKLRDPTEGAPPIVNVPKRLIGDVQSTRTEMTVVAAPSNAEGLVEIKFAVPKESHGFEGVADPPRALQDKLVKAAGVEEAAVGDGGGAEIGTFENVQLVQPNGSFTITIHQKAIFLKDAKNGAVHRVTVSNVSRLFLLPVPNVEAHYFVIALKVPLRVGQQQHQCIVFNIADDMAIDAAEPWKPSGIKSDADVKRLFPDLGDKALIKPEMSGSVREVLASVFKTVVQAPLTGANGDFTNGDTGTCAMAAQLKGGTGNLFVLKNFLLFLHRPATLIPYAGLTIVETQVFAATSTITFEMTKETGAKEKVSIGGVKSKPDFHDLIGYLKAKGVDTPELEDDEEDEEDDEEDSDYNEADDSDDGDDDDFADSDDEGSEKPSKKHRKEKKEKKSKKEKKDKKDKKDKKSKKEKKDKKDKH
jgi:hypothetical protein